jgi:hypothetical protein
MPGYLKIDIQQRRLSKCGRIVSQQYRGAPNISSSEGFGQVFSPTLANHASTVVIDANEIEDRFAFSNLDAFVAKCSHPKLTRLRDPRNNARVVVVIPCNEEDTALRAKPAKRSNFIGEGSHVTIRQVARHRDQIRGEIIHPTHDVLCKSPAENLPDVDVRDLDDPESIQRSWPALELDLHPLVARRAHARSKRDDSRDRNTARHQRRSDCRNRRLFLGSQGRHTDEASQPEQHIRKTE